MSASLPTPDIVRTVALGPDGLFDGSAIKVFVDTSTTGPRVAAEIAVGLAAAGVASIDCPVSGGMAGARDGKLTLMVPGPVEVVEGSTKLLGLLGNLFYVGDTPGAAQTVKNDANLAMMRLRDGQVTGRVVLAADGS